MSQLKKAHKVMSVVLSLVLLFGSTSQSYAQSATPNIRIYKASQEPIAKFISTTNNNGSWRDGLVTGNGENAVIASCNPTDDILIFQNTKFNMSKNDLRDTPLMAPALDKMRQEIMNGSGWKAYTTAEDEIEHNLGWLSWQIQYDYSFHPGHQLRMNIPASGSVTNYKRWTDYATAEIGVEYSDSNGDWLRKTFASREDNVIITYITPPTGKSTFDMTLSIDAISSMAKESGSYPNLQYKIIVPQSADYIAQVAHYPTFNNAAELNKGGYAGVTSIFTDGVKKKVTTENSDSKNVGENAKVAVTGASRIVLITKSDRDVQMGELGSFRAMSDYPLLNRLSADTQNVYTKYSVNNVFDYDSALQAHTAKHTPLFTSVKLDLNGDSIDREMTNEQLLAKQRANKSSLNKALLERIFSAGRYTQICSSGYSTSRLGGIWTGAWNPMWQGDFTTDANVNLQISGVNTGHMKDAAEGYINFILRIADDWEYNAKRIYGIENALMAPPRTDGENGYIYHFNRGYPFNVWNAGASWLLLPIFEYWQCYGNQNIPVPAGLDLNNQSLKSVLDLSNDDVSRIGNDGFLDLETDILLPLLTKQANFWKGFVNPNFYEDAAGNAKMDKNHNQLASGEKYLLLPGYSPENSTKGSPVAANVTMDIAAARDGFDMVIAMERAVNGENSPAIVQWQELKENMPAYKYDETGALREWSSGMFAENNNHRHVSHLYPVWPGYEGQNNMELRQGAIKAIENRNKYNTGDNKASHGWMHKALVAARLKDAKQVITCLSPGITGKIYYPSLMTSHDTDGGSAYCTDTAITTPSIINEALVFSQTGEIEILPALPADWAQGAVKGILARTQAEVVNLEWNTARKAASVTVKSNKAQTITLKCGIAWTQADVTGIPQNRVVKTNDKKILLTLQQGETATILFTEEPLAVNNSYAIIDSGKFVSVAAASTDEGAAVEMQDVIIPNEALWIETVVNLDQAAIDNKANNNLQYGNPVPGTYYGYTNAVTGKNIDINDKRFTTNYGKIATWGGPINVNEPSRYFHLADAGNGYVSIQTCFLRWTGIWDKYTQKVFTLDSNGNVGHCSSDTNDDTQKWTKVVVGDKVAFLNKGNGKYLKPGNNETDALTTTLVSEDTTTIQKHQVWSLQGDSVNQCRIVNFNSGKALAAQGNELVQKAQGDIWSIVTVANGFKVMAPDGRGIKNNDGILVLTNSSEATEFALKKVDPLAAAKQSILIPHPEVKPNIEDKEKQPINQPDFLDSGMV